MKVGDVVVVNDKGAHELGFLPVPPPSARPSLYPLPRLGDVGVVIAVYADAVEVRFLRPGVGEWEMYPDELAMAPDTQM